MTRPKRLSWRRLGGLSAIIVLSLVGACSDEADQPVVKRQAPSPAPAIYQLERLDRGDQVKPELWLASRRAGQDLAETAVEVEELRQMLEVAGKRFRDYPRMIANRAVQLEDMLHDKGLAEPATQLISDLSEVPGDKRYVESFGALSQQYYNLRLQGLDRQEALNLLKRGGNESN